MNDIERSQGEVQQNIQSLTQDKDLQSPSRIWLHEVTAYKYRCNFTWMDLPIIQYPQGMPTTQQLIWEVKPDLITETGIACGGSLIFYASMFEPLTQSGYDEGTVLGIDIDIRQHNREATEARSITRRIQMLQGSSIDSDIVEQVRRTVAGKQRVLVVLDSNHAHDHMLAELEAYAPLISVDSYCVAFDTAVEDVPQTMFDDHPWGIENNPKTAMYAYLRDRPKFTIDADIHHRLLITIAPDSYLKHVT